MQLNKLTAQLKQTGASNNGAETRPSVIDAALVAQLRADIDGQVITAEDSGYDEARKIFYGGFDRRPLVSVRPADTAGVSEVVSLARVTGIPLAVRSGGHSYAGHSLVARGIVLDLKLLNSLHI